MDLRTRSLSVIALLPPGPQERELQRFATELFEDGGEPDTLAFPGILPLAAGNPLGDLGEDELAALWQGLQGDFSTGSLVMEEGGVYLRLEGPLAALAARASLLVSEGTGFPVLLGRGFFFGKRKATALEGHSPRAPSLSFRAASLTLYDCGFESAGLRVFCLKERARAWRPGPRAGKARSPRGKSGPKGTDDE